MASEVATLGYSDRSKLTYAVQDVIKDIVDGRAVSWLMYNMVNQKPSDLAEMLEAREAKISRKYAFAKQQRDYNQITPVPQKAKKKSYGHER